MINLIQMKKQKLIAILFLANSFGAGYAQQKKELIEYGDMEQWVTRTIHESSIIGGHKKTLYEIGPTQTIDGNIAYSNLGNSPWANSNVYAKVAGIVKTNNTVYKEEREDGGFCARLETHIEKVKVLGLVNINVLAAGAIYLGDMKEPVTGTKAGVQGLNSGIPFTKRPSSLIYDYKVKLANQKNRIKLTGFSSRETIPGIDCAITYLYLQKRTEDANGNLFAKRVGTLIVKYDKSTDGWINNASYEIKYGDISDQPDFDPEYMGLRSVDYARNSKGQNVIVKETGWADADEEPTHLIVQFSSSHGGAFVGSPGNTFWIDNVSLGYE